MRDDFIPLFIRMHLAGQSAIIEASISTYLEKCLEPYWRYMDVLPGSFHHYSHRSSQHHLNIASSVQGLSLFSDAIDILHRTGHRLYSSFGNDLLHRMSPRYRHYHQSYFRRQTHWILSAIFTPRQCSADENAATSDHIYILPICPIHFWLGSRVSRWAVSP